MIIRHQRASSRATGFRQLARYIRGRTAEPRATWFLAANLPGVVTTAEMELACRLVDSVQAQNTRARSSRTYHVVVSLHPEDRTLDGKELKHVVESVVDTLGFSEHQYIAVRHNDKDHEHVHVAINKIHPETFRIHAPAWDHQKLFDVGRTLEAELGLTPLHPRARERVKTPQRAADCEAHQGIDSFASWASKTLGPALRGRELQSWDNLHEVCGRFGVVLRLHGNGLVFEDAEQGVRVKASFVGREFSKSQLCNRLGDFQLPSVGQREAAARVSQRYSPMPVTVPHSLWQEYAHSLERARLDRQNAWSGYRDAAERDWRSLKSKHRQQRRIIAALPVSATDRKQLRRQLSLQRAVETRTLRAKLARQRKAIQKSPHPGAWRHFVAGRARHGDPRAIRLLHTVERQRDAQDWERGL